MSLLDQKAAAVVAELEKDNQMKGVGSDTPFLDFIKEVFTTLLPALLACFASPAGAHKQLQSPNIWTRAKLGATIRQHLGHEEFAVRKVRDAILKVGKESTVEEITTLASEV